MRTLRITSLLALLLTTFAVPQTASARAVEQTAAGIYQFVLSQEEDKYLKYVEFDARTLAEGGATGSIYFSDEAVIYDQDVDGTGKEGGKFAGYNLKADVDEMVVTENKAVLSGVIRVSSVPAFVGQRFLLTIEDNGDNSREPDRLTWGIYKPSERGWVPSDAELKEDPGVGLRWWATDAERKDDVGYQMPRSEEINAQSFPIASYNFVEVTDSAGDIRITQ